jgi:hypothetical protein
LLRSPGQRNIIQTFYSLFKSTQIHSTNWKQAKESVREKAKEHSLIIIIIHPHAMLTPVYIHCTCFTLHTIFHFIVITTSRRRMGKVETSQFFSFSLYTAFIAA